MDSNTQGDVLLIQTQTFSRSWWANQSPLPIATNMAEICFDQIQVF